MRTYLTSLILASTTLAFAAGAQTAQLSHLRVHDGSNEIVTRGRLGSLGGECLQRVSKNALGGIPSARGVSATLYDGYGRDCHNYEVILRKALPTGAPDLTPGGLLYRSGVLRSRCHDSWRLPVRYGITVNFKKAVDLPTGGFFFGIRFLNAPTNFPGNGLQIYASADYSDTKNPKAPCGEHPRMGVSPDMAWNVFYLGPNPSHAARAGNHAWDMTLLTDTSVIQPYAVDPVGPKRCTSKRGVRDVGYAGLWPDLSDREKYGYKADFGWKVHDARRPKGAAFVFVSCRRLASPITLTHGPLWIDPGCLLFSQFTVLDASGVGHTAPIRLPDTLRAPLSGASLWAQALTIDQTTGKAAFSSWSRTSF